MEAVAVPRPTSAALLSLTFQRIAVLAVSLDKYLGEVMADEVTRARCGLQENSPGIECLCGQFMGIVFETADVLLPCKLDWHVLF
jgi:hypothetical protein